MKDKKEKKFTDFELDDNSSKISKSTKIDYFPEPEAEQVNYHHNETVIAPSIERVNTFQLDIRNRPIKNVRLQLDITNELEQELKVWMKRNKITKKTDAVEALLRHALGLKQIL